MGSSNMTLSEESIYFYDVLPASVWW